MHIPLTAGERAVLETWVEAGNQPQQRRARIMLLRDGGLDSRSIADQVGLSQRQVRHWLAEFRKRRIGVFPRSVQDGLVEIESQPEVEVPSTATEPVMAVGDEPEDLAPAAPLSVEALCEVYDVDLGRANHVKGLALQLFDLTAEAHRLPSARRFLLGAAATLHNLGVAQNPAKRHLVARDLIMAQPIIDLDAVERDMLASIVAFHRKRVRRGREIAFMRLPAGLQQQTLALAALLRMAAGLDASESQSTTFSHVEAQDGNIVIVVEGPVAEQDAAAALRLSKLWNRQFDIQLNFSTEEQLAQASMETFGKGYAFIRRSGVDLDLVPDLKSPGILPGDPMSEAGRKVLWFHFLRMVKHEPGTRLGEDIEELHDMRVATRRMRAALRVFGGFFEAEAIAPYNRGLRRVTRALGPVRDLDVFEEKARRYLKSLPDVEAARGALDPLIETWHAERAGARETMLAFLDSDRYYKFKCRFAEFLQTERAGASSIPQDRPIPYQVRHVAPRLIYTRYETVRAYEPVLENAQIEVLHALRIDCKYLRYTLEFLDEVLGPEGEMVIEEVKVMQDHLGDLNDAEVAIDLLSEFPAKWELIQRHVPLGQRRSVEGVLTYLTSRHAEKHRLLITFPEAWDRLNRDEVRRWLALAIAVL